MCGCGQKNALFIYFAPAGAEEERKGGHNHHHGNRGGQQERWLPVARGVFRAISRSQLSQSAAGAKGTGQRDAHVNIMGSVLSGGKDKVTPASPEKVRHSN